MLGQLFIDLPLPPVSGPTGRLPSTHQTPSTYAGGCQKIMEISPTSRQPRREPWSLERLNYERSILLGMSIDTSTASTYSSALNSYLTFCKMHGLPVEPTPQTLSYYTTFQSFHINPKSVDSYLSGVCNQLEAFFPDVRKNRTSTLVTRTLAGAKRYRGSPTTRKSPLTVANLVTVSTNLASSTDHDDLLFNAQLNTGFTGLLRLGEITWPNKISLRDYKKVTMRFSLDLTPTQYSFWLPTHKADTVFEGNKIVVCKISGAPDPLPIMVQYIKSRDARFSFHPQLWLKADGTIPLRSWFMNRLSRYFGPHIAGQSMRAGGATAMAEAGAVPQLIKGAGRWSSTAFERYIRKNPVVLHALILSRTSHYDTTTSSPN